MLTILGGRRGASGPVARDTAAWYRQGGEAVLLVPEQYTLKAERDMLDAPGAPGFSPARSPLAL